MKPENNSCLPLLRVGILVNPLAGLGGPLAHKGSDDLSAAGLTTSTSRSHQRMVQMLRHVTPCQDRLCLKTVSGLMGEDAIREAGMTSQVVWSASVPSSAVDTREAVRRLEAAGVDLLVFAGGDGTARNVCEAAPGMPVLGLPAGVKMHSGVFAVNPQSAAELLLKLLDARGVSIETAEVRDLDEDALRQGQVRPRFFGELRTPFDPRLVQQMKCGTPDSDALVQAEIAAGVVEAMEDGVVYLLCPGTTTSAVMEALGFHHTLLGIDAVLDGKLVARDLDSRQIAGLALEHPLRVLLTVTGGQGMLLGRGNQQLTPSLLRQLGRTALWVLATSHKLQTLAGRPLRLDTGDEELDAAWRGLIEVTTGYRSRQLCWLT